MINFFGKEFWIMAIGWGLPMAIIMTLFYGIIDGFSWTFFGISIVTFLIIGGPVFAAAITLFTQYIFKKIHILIPEEESLIKEYGANLFKGKEGVGGKVALTDKSVIFKSHKVNIQTGETIIDIQDITGFEIKNRIFNLLNNQITLTTAIDNYKFIIQERDDFIKELKKLNTSI